ncbi:histidinol-phosphate transaminase [Synechococcus sp. PCC 7336]|uniref:histidinol-phosphate transaminase n=1 Tax=Synechococcus sp. PCC 7336 TaxID=195250 RepID=UPI00034D9D73|nr:histidinol-phosphate transaminase [Synechococcus sp. PCC 7336]
MDAIRPSLLNMQPYEAEILPHADKLDANEYPEDLPEWFKKKLSLVWEKGIHSNRYPDATHSSLKRAIADYAGLDDSLVSLGNGSDELIRSILIATCLEGRGSILVSPPTFSMYAIEARSLGIPAISIPRNPDTFALDLPACTEAIERDNVRVVFLVSPNSPTGTPLTAEELDWARSLPESIAVVIDEAYFEFSQATVVPELERRPNWIVLRTFSKAFRLAAHRVGYAIASADMVRALEVTRLPYNLPALSQWAAQLALEFADDLLANIPTLLADRDRLRAELSLIPQVQVWPSSANFLYFRVRDWDLAQLQQQLIQRGTGLRYTGGGLRLSVGTPAQNCRFLVNLRAILAPVPQHMA